MHKTKLYTWRSSPKEEDPNALQFAHCVELTAWRGNNWSITSISSVGLTAWLLQIDLLRHYRKPSPTSAARDILNRIGGVIASYHTKVQDMHGDCFGSMISVMAWSVWKERNIRSDEEKKVRRPEGIAFDSQYSSLAVLSKLLRR